MPEGPEIRRAADAVGRALVGPALSRIEYRVPRLARKAKRLAGASVTRVHARGKALLIDFDCGITHYSHNQLYGEWEVTRTGEALDSHRVARVVLATPARTATLYSATQIDLVPTAQVDAIPYIASLGPDILDAATTEATLRARLDDPRFRRRSLASLLLDQGFVAGLGNYLRSDILFAAGLTAGMRPADLDDAQRAALAREMRRLARQSYRTRGVTNDVARAKREAGRGAAFEDYRFLVYGREGNPCWTCGTTIVRHDAGGRGLFHCPACQPSGG